MGRKSTQSLNFAQIVHLTVSFDAESIEWHACLVDRIEMIFHALYSVIFAILYVLGFKNFAKCTLAFLCNESVPTLALARGKKCRNYFLMSVEYLSVAT